MTPLSETTILVPQLVGGGLTVGEHVRNMFWTAGPALGISLVIFLVLGLNAEPEAELSTDAARDALAAAFNISFVNLLPLLLLVVFAIFRFPPFLSILGSALFAGILAPFTQWEAVKAFVDDPSLGPVATAIEAIFGAMATGFVSNSGRRTDRRAVLPGRHGEPADHDLAGARRAVVRRGHGARRLPPAAAAARSCRGRRTRGSLIARGQLQRHRPERHRR